MSLDSSITKIVVFWEGEVLSSEEFYSTLDEEICVEFSAVVAFIPKHYPDPSGITVNAVGNNGEGDLLYTHTFY